MLACSQRGEVTLRRTKQIACAPPCGSAPPALAPRRMEAIRARRVLEMMRAPAYSDVMQPPVSAIRPTDQAARELARGLIEGASFGALGVLHPMTGSPHVARIALMPATGGGLIAFISALALHTRALAAAPHAGVLLGEPGPKGDPLTHPRLSLGCSARFLSPDEATAMNLRGAWLSRHPKARVYVDLPDFRFVHLAPTGALLNGGFGRAFELSADDLAP